MSDIENNVTSEQNFCIISPVKDEVITEKHSNSIARLLGKSEDNLMLLVLETVQLFVMSPSPEDIVILITTSSKKSSFINV